MKSLQEHISLINGKLQQLIKQYQSLQAENAKQTKAISVLQQNEEDLKVKLDTLQQQHLILKASITPLDNADKKELEQKINAYLRNIDKCISLLAQ